MKISNTKDYQSEIPVYMLIYGNGGIGKTTFAAGAPGPFMADCENGAKYLGRRGIHIPVANIETWGDFAGAGGFVDMAIKNEKVLTIIVDPIGELMEKCKMGLGTGGGLTDSSGAPTLKGWGEMSTRMKTQFRRLRDSGKNVILVAHVDEKDDEGRMVKRPKIQTKISEDIINMVDIVAYMDSKVNESGIKERVLIVDPSNDKVTAKDRTGMLPLILQPSFSFIQEAINGLDEKPTPSQETHTDPAVSEVVNDTARAVEESRQTTLSATKSKLAKTTENAS